ncbi:hypothetical protein LCGC14_2502390, partial [marine sediment metagenome]
MDVYRRLHPINYDVWGESSLQVCYTGRGNMETATRRQALGGAGERSGHHNRSIAAQAFIQQWKIINCGG